MFSTTCFHCGHPAHITPDQPLCARCGQNLRDMIPSEVAVRYFYDRAANLAAQQETAEALAEAERGFAQTQINGTGGDSSLRLLAAMLAQQLDQPDLMRHHVAHIELDDVLRGEAEWLLRSHQAGRRSSRQLAKMRNGQSRDQAGGVGRGQRFLPAQAVIGPRTGGPAADAPSRRWSSYAALLLMLLVGAGAWGGWRLLSPTGDAPAVVERPADGGEVDNSSEVDNEVAATAESAEDVLPTEARAVLPSATPSPTATSAPQLAANATEVAVEILASQPFEWQTFLLEQGEAELAQLPVAARLVDNVLRLQGSVETDAQRRRLAELAATVPEVSDVNLVELRLKLPETYTARQGDTLWLIAYNLYGDPARVADLLEANRDRLASPEALRAGQELVVPE